MDYELELGVYLSGGKTYGESISTGTADDYVFDFVILNDWSGTTESTFMRAGTELTEPVQVAIFNALSLAVRQGRFWPSSGSSSVPVDPSQPGMGGHRWQSYECKNTNRHIA